MTKKQIVILIVLAVFMLAAVITAFVSKKKTSNLMPAFLGGEKSGGDIGNQVSGGALYSPTLPANAVPTVPKNSAPASANPELDTQIKFFDMKATASGFIPSSITVVKGDSLQVDFTAVDSDYDLDIPYLGAYFSVVKKGTSRRLIFDTSTPGTFAFQCRDFCPQGKTIQGTLVVLP